MVDNTETKKRRSLIGCLRLLLIVTTVFVTFQLGSCHAEYTEYTSEEITPLVSESREEIESKLMMSEEGFEIFYDVQPPYYGASIDNPVKLKNNPSAENPTWHDLKDFLQADTTDKNSYIPGIQVCADFAADLHDRAEEAGIKAAWVSLDFVDDPIGHALNAFETTDQGLIFVDCTGGVPEIQIPQIDTDTGEIIEPTTCFDSHDKRAYIKIGEECGFIGIDVIAGFDYESFTKYQIKWDLLEERINGYAEAVESYNDRVNQFNDDVGEYEELVGGRTVIEDIAEYNKLNTIYQELSAIERELKQESSILSLEAYHIDSELENLGRCRREPLGVVKTVGIYW